MFHLFNVHYNSFANYKSPFQGVHFPPLQPFLLYFHCLLFVLCFEIVTTMLFFLTVKVALIHSYQHLLFSASTLTSFCTFGILYHPTWVFMFNYFITFYRIAPSFNLSSLFCCFWSHLLFTLTRCCFPLPFSQPCCADTKVQILFTVSFAILLPSPGCIPWQSWQSTEQRRQR